MGLDELIDFMHQILQFDVATVVKTSLCLNKQTVVELFIQTIDVSKYGNYAFYPLI